MSNVLILCRHDERSDYDQKDTYAHGMSVLDSQNNYTYGELEQLVFSYDGKSLQVYLDGRDIRDFDQLFLIGWFKSKILEDVALSVAKYMDFHGKVVRNSEVLFTRSRSKLSQYVVAALNDINLTPFLFCMDKAAYIDAFNLYWTAGYPIIMKGAQASRGNDNYLIKNEAGVSSTLQVVDSKDGPWFVTQSFVPNDGDYRIIVMGDEIKYVIHRQSQQGSHLNNTSKGGQASELPVNKLPQDVQKQCILLAQLLRREITGVDMIQHNQTGEFYLLEINNMPQLATGSYVSKKLTALDAYLSGLK